jgi:hypothetical protein
VRKSTDFEEGGCLARVAWDAREPSLHMGSSVCVEWVVVYSAFEWVFQGVVVWSAFEWVFRVGGGLECVRVCVRVGGGLECTRVGVSSGW